MPHHMELSKQRFLARWIVLVSCTAGLWLLTTTIGGDRPLENHSTKGFFRQSRPVPTNNGDTSSRSLQLTCNVGGANGGGGGGGGGGGTDDADDADDADDTDDADDADDATDDEPIGPQVQVCRTRISTKTGYAVDANKKRYDFCSNDEVETLEDCQTAAEANADVLGFSYDDTKTYCEHFFDQTVSLNDVDPFCSPGFAAGSSTRQGRGVPVDVTGAPNVISYVCTPPLPQEQTCETPVYPGLVLDGGFCVDSDGQQYDSCFKEDMSSVLCQQAAESSIYIVGFTYVESTLTCHLHYSNEYSGTNVRPLCLPGFEPGSSAADGVGDPASVEPIKTLTGRDGTFTITPALCVTCRDEPTLPDPQLCDKPVSRFPGYCLDAIDQEYDYCFSASFSRLECQTTAETWSLMVGLAPAAVGWAYSGLQAPFLCQIYFDNRDQDRLVCPARMYLRADADRSVGIGYPGGVDGTVGTECYSCAEKAPRPEPQNCGTAVQGVGYCADVAGRAYDYCLGGLSPAACRTAAELDWKAVGYSVNTDRPLCRLFYDNDDSSGDVDKLCPEGFFPGADGSVYLGTGPPLDTDGTANARCFRCTAPDPYAPSAGPTVVPQSEPPTILESDPPTIVESEPPSGPDESAPPTIDSPQPTILPTTEPSTSPPTLEPTDSPPVALDCSDRLTANEGFCRNNVGQQFNNCYMYTTPQYCRQFAQRTGKALGRSFRADFYCEVYFDPSTDLFEVCPPESGFRLGKTDSRAMGPVATVEFAKGTSCYTCDELPQAATDPPLSDLDCSTEMALPGFCRSITLQAYDYCQIDNTLREFCQASAESTGNAVGYSFKEANGYCEVLFDNADSGNIVGRLCPDGIFGGASDRDGVGPVSATDGDVKVTCNVCQPRRR